MPRHEGVEVLGGVLPACVLLQQPVEVLEHLVDGLPVGLGGVLQRLLHPGEALVEDLAAEQVLDLLERLARLTRLPVVVAELGHRGRRRVREVLQAHLAEGAVAVVHHRVAGELLALLQDRLVQQLADLVQRPVEMVLLQQLAAALGHPAREIVQPGLVLAAAAQELLHRPLGAVARHHVLADGVERLGDVDRRRERVPAVVPAVATHDRVLPTAAPARSARGISATSSTTSTSPASVASSAGLSTRTS